MHTPNNNDRQKGTFASIVGKMAGIAVIFLIGFGCLEFLGYQLLQLQLRNHHYLFEFPIDTHLASLSDRYIGRWASGKGVYRSDPDLGWIRTPGRQRRAPEGWTLTSDDTGAREIPGQHGPVWLSTYGDSFTECVEVDDDQSWQAYLVDEVGGQIRNYGVAGYGPDQSLLYIEKNLELGRHTPIVILAMIEENLERNLNSYRPYYTWPNVDFALGFKPRFVQVSGGDFVLMNPIPKDWDRGSLKTAMIDAAQIDQFHQRRVEQIEFPYTLTAAGLIRRQGLILDEWQPRKSALAAATLGFILDRFEELSHRYGFVPVLVLLPSSGKQIEHVQHGHVDYVRRVVETRAPDQLVFINVLADLAGPEGPGYLQGLTSDRFARISHASAEANAVVARALSTKLLELRGTHEARVQNEPE